jgi:hypothetical protein
MSSFQIIYYQQLYTPAILAGTQELVINNEYLLDFLPINTIALQQCIKVLEILNFKFIATRITTTIKNELKV